MFKFLTNIFFLIIFLSSCSQKLTTKINTDKEKKDKIQTVKFGVSNKTGVIISE